MTVTDTEAAAAYSVLLRGATRDLGRMDHDLKKIGAVGAEAAVASRNLEKRLAKAVVGSIAREVVKEQIAIAAQRWDDLKDTGVDLLTRREEQAAIVVAYRHRLQQIEQPAGVTA